MSDTIYIATKTIQDFQNSSSSVGLKDYLGLIALFSSALVAVLVGQYLQVRKSENDREYNNKFSIFATILGLRHSKGMSEQFVIAINQIPIVFHKNFKVLSKLNTYIKTHQDFSLDDDTSSKQLISDLNDLVIEIAKDLGYNDMDNQVMRTYFYPKASEFRYSQDVIYNELYVLQRSGELLEERKKGDNPSNSQ